MYARRLLFAFWIAVIYLMPAMSYARSPLTDSTDVKVSVGGSEVEDHIVVSPLDPKLLLVSSILVETGVKTWISQDAGKTWRKFGNLISGGVDPIGAISPHVGSVGRFLTNTVQVEIDVDYKDTLDSTASLTHVVIEPPGTMGWDKDYLWVDKRSTGTYSKQIYCGFSDNVVPGGPELVNGRVYLRYSTDNGATWSGQVNFDAGATTDQYYIGINLATAPDDGRVYAAWVSRDVTTSQEPAKALMFRYSTTGGSSWTSPSGGQLIKSLQGFGRHSLVGKTMRTTVSPSMVVAGNGDIYVVYADKESGHTDTDIYILKSGDKGATWRVPGGSGNGYKRVNPGGSGQANQDQWFPWIVWDDCTDALVVGYYDSRNDTQRVNTYLAVSYDGGVTWNSQDELKVSDVDWDGDPPVAGGEAWAGDYIGVAARDGIAYPVWSDDRVTSHSYRVYTSPLYLWGVNQSSVTHTVVSGPGLTLTVTVNWTTNLSATGADYLVLTAPSGLQYTTTATGTGTTHSLTRICLCEAGKWKYIVKSTRPGFTSRGSNQGGFVASCIE